MKIFTIGVATLALALAAAGCSKSDDGAAPPRLLDTGAPPKSSVEYRPAPGPSRGLELLVEMTLDVQFGASTHPAQRVPPLKVALDLEDDAERPGTIRISIAKLELGEGGDPQRRAEWLEDLATHDLTGRRGEARYDSRGRCVAVDLEIPKNCPSGLRQLLLGAASAIELASIPLPSDPLGTGARLGDSREVTLNSMKMALDATWTLVEVAGPRLTFDGELSLRGAPQPIELPGAKKGSRAELLGASASGRARVVVATDRAGPQEAKLDLTVDMEVRTIHDGKDTTLRSKSELRYSLRPR